MIDITESFLRTLQFRLEECSTYAQFSEFFIKNKSILYNETSYKLFTARLSYIKLTSNDNMTRKMCDDLFEDIEEEHSITYVSDSKGKLPFNLQFHTEEGRVYKDAVTEMIKAVYIKAKGKKKEVCRILGIEPQALEKLLDSDKDRRRVIIDAKKSFKVLKDQ